MGVLVIDEGASLSSIDIGTGPGMEGSPEMTGTSDSNCEGEVSCSPRFSELVVGAIFTPQNTA